MPEAPEPVFDTELSPELQKAFREMFFHHAFDFPKCWNGDNDAAEAAAVLLYQRIKKVVSVHPILARAINTNGQTLLEQVIVGRATACRDTLQFLIEANPHALIWEHGVRRHRRGKQIAPIHWLGESFLGEGLLPWIMEKYPWVFQHQLCQENPPHVAMVRSWVYNRCDLETVRSFYELYPQGLREKESNFDK
jgi:hypothetical protein